MNNTERNDLTKDIKEFTALMVESLNKIVFTKNKAEFLNAIEITMHLATDTCNEILDRLNATKSVHGNTGRPSKRKGIPHTEETKKILRFKRANRVKRKPVSTNI